MTLVYLVLCALGTALPLSQFLPWFFQHGLNVSLLFSKRSGSRISAGAWLDVVVSALVVLVFIVREGNQIGVQKLWVAIVGLFTVGPSLGLPLFLLLRENHLSAGKTMT